MTIFRNGTLLVKQSQLSLQQAVRGPHDLRKGVAPEWRRACARALRNHWPTATDASAHHPTQSPRSRALISIRQNVLKHCVSSKTARAFTSAIIMKLTSFVPNFNTALIFPIQVNPDVAVNVTNMLCILLYIIYNLQQSFLSVQFSWQIRAKMRISRSGALERILKYYLNIFFIFLFDDRIA